MLNAVIVRQAIQHLTFNTEITSTPLGSAESGWLLLGG